MSNFVEIVQDFHDNSINIKLSDNSQNAMYMGVEDEL